MNVKKYKLKYDYLKLELKDTEELLREYQLKWNQKFSKYYEGLPVQQEIWINEETGEVRNELPQEPVDKDNKQYKLLYRQLSLKTHPDHGGDQEDFTRIKDAYESNNILELLSFADKYDIQFTFNENDAKFLEQSCTKIELKIAELKKSLAWSYFTGDKDTKMKCIEQVKKATGKPINIRDITDAL